jgi:hypothetical protein
MEEELLASRLLADDLKGSHRQRKYVDVRHEDPSYRPWTAKPTALMHSAQPRRKLLKQDSNNRQNQRHRGKRGCSRSTSHRKNYLKESRTPSKYQKKHDRIQHRRHRHQCLCPQPLRYHMRFPYPRVA